MTPEPIINIIAYMAIGLSIAILIPIGIIIGIVYAVKSSDAGDSALKKKYRKTMWWSFFGPFGFVALTTILFGLVQVIRATLAQP